MFEAEVEMEKRSSILPLLLMACLVVAILGLVTYVLIQARGKTPLSAQEATGIATAAIHEAGPAVIHFRTGLVKPSGDEKPGAPNYRLLEKAGIVKLSKGPRESVRVAISPKGENLLATISGCTKTKETDGTTLYQAPLADRQLLSIAGVSMIGDNTAVVEYNWKWTPNTLGNVFDAGGPLVKSFNTWERQTLINKYQADFYNDSPKKSTLALVRAERGWKLSR
jgi:hypothetical protein